VKSLRLSIAVLNATCYTSEIPRHFSGFTLIKRQIFFFQSPFGDSLTSIYAVQSLKTISVERRKTLIGSDPELVEDDGGKLKDDNCQSELDDG